VYPLNSFTIRHGLPETPHQVDINFMRMIPLSAEQASEQQAVLITLVEVEE
jgi:hypothetical protein